jgi:hypothetical protein
MKQIKNRVIGLLTATIPPTLKKENVDNAEIILNTHRDNRLHFLSPDSAKNESLILHSNYWKNESKCLLTATNNAKK